MARVMTGSTPRNAGTRASGSTRSSPAFGAWYVDSFRKTAHASNGVACMRLATNPGPSRPSFATSRAVMVHGPRTRGSPHAPTAPRRGDDGAAADARVRSGRVKLRREHGERLADDEGLVLLLERDPSVAEFASHAVRGDAVDELAHGLFRHHARSQAVAHARHRLFPEEHRLVLEPFEVDVRARVGHVHALVEGSHGTRLEDATELRRILAHAGQVAQHPSPNMSSRSGTS